MQCCKRYVLQSKWDRGNQLFIAGERKSKNKLFKVVCLPDPLLFCAIANMNGIGRLNIPWAKAQQSRCSWFCRDIPHGFWRWEGFPFQIQCHRQANGSTGIPGGSRMTQTLSWQHRERNPPIQLLKLQCTSIINLRVLWYLFAYLLCSDPWPSCCQLQTVQRQSCQGGKPDRRDLIARSPWCRAPSRPGRPWERICHRRPHCSRRWCAPTGGHCRRGRCQWDRCRARRRWSPRTRKRPISLHMSHQGLVWSISQSSTLGMSKISFYLPGHDDYNYVSMKLNSSPCLHFQVCFKNNNITEPPLFLVPLISIALIPAYHHKKKLQALCH